MSDNYPTQDGGVYAVGTIIELDATSEAVIEAVKAGVLSFWEDEIVESGNMPAEVAPVKEEAPVAPVEPGSIADTEPRARYRGMVVMSESERTVGEQTFKHIVCDNGTEYDLTDAEYTTEVKVSYPPTK